MPRCWMPGLQARYYSSRPLGKPAKKPAESALGSQAMDPFLCHGSLPIDSHPQHPQGGGLAGFMCPNLQHFSQHSVSSGHVLSSNIKFHSWRLWCALHICYSHIVRLLFCQPKPGYQKSLMQSMVCPDSARIDILPCVLMSFCFSLETSPGHHC